MRLAGPHSRKLTIFEGPDGGGKSTAAQRLASATHAHYVHCGPFQSLTNSADLARMYVEAMMPAVLGHRDVVMDRCWISEVPYGHAYRQGKLRLKLADVAMLERLALRCATVLVAAVPPFDVVKATWESRKGQELLETAAQVKEVHSWYAMSLPSATALPMMFYDYRKTDLEAGRTAMDYNRTSSHPVGFQSSGNLSAPIVIVGEGFGAVKPGDPGYQWCFASFSQSGCSQWLTQQLLAANVAEQHLVWINADQTASKVNALIDAYPRKIIVALGGVAQQLLSHRSETVVADNHPQFHKRFKAGEPYPVIQFLKEKFVCPTL